MTDGGESHDDARDATLDDHATDHTAMHDDHDETASTTRETTTTRRRFMRGAAAGTAAATGLTATTGTAAAASGGLTAPAAAFSSLWGYSLPTSHAPSYGNGGVPGWLVQVEDTDDGTDPFENLRTWVDGSSDRELLKELPASNTGLVRAPAGAVGAAGIDSYLGRGLKSLSWVESVDLNLYHEVDPITVPKTEDQYTEMADSWYAFGRGSLSATGLAFSDNSKKTATGTVRDMVGLGDVSADGAGVTVAVLDTGTNVANGEVYGDGTAGSALRITAAKNFVSGETVDVSASNPDWSTVADGNDHGSHVSATAVGAGGGNSTYKGMAPGASLVVGKVLGDDGSGDTATIVEGIQWAATDAGADVIIMSLGSPIWSSTLEQACADALESGATAITIAAGNSRQHGVGPASPGDADDVICVGATNSGDQSDLASVKSASFSQVGPDDGIRDLSSGATRGAAPHVGAVGVKLDARHGTTSGTTTETALSGTSMANPVVGGIAAVVLAADSSLSGDPSALRDRLTATAVPAEACATTEIGAGMAHAANAIAETEPEDDQEAAMSSQAASRDAAHSALGGSVAVSAKSLLGFRGW